MEEQLENLETAENTETAQNVSDASEGLLQVSREMEEAGNHDMAEYYAKKAEQAIDAEQSSLGSAKLGGWHAGYTANEWREKAKEEFVKNGDTLKYKQYCDNAMKAQG